MRLYHPTRKPPANEFVTDSDDELHVKVYLDAGWLPAPEPEASDAAHAPEPVRYEPVAPAAKPAAKSTKAAKAADK